MKRFIKNILLVLILLFVTGLLFSQEVDAVNKSKDNPTEVAVSFLILDIIKIDDFNKEMSVDIGIKMEWKDKSLAGKKQTILLENNNAVWRPELQFLNSINLTPKIKEALVVTEDGSVSFIQRFVGEVSISADFSDFPMDDHDFNIKVVGINIDSLIFINNQPPSFKMPELTQAEWDISDYQLTIVPFDTQIRLLPGFEFQMHFKRKVQYYFWKTIFPLTLVIFMSWTVFWVHPSQLAAQIAITVTSMLTLVTFQFVLSTILPPLSYLTKMDVFVLGANLIIFFALIEAVFSSYHFQRDHQRIAEKADKWSRVVFPLLLLLILVLVWLW